MTTAVTKESLAARIADLEYGPRSLKEDYTLAAYKMLLATMEADPEGLVMVPSSAMTPRMLMAVQMNSELGSYAAANLVSAYSLFDEFWREACRAAVLDLK